MTSEDWRDIQNAVSNSDLPNERRLALLDIIDCKLAGIAGGQRKAARARAKRKGT